MKVCHPLEFESAVEGGVKVSTRQQRAALETVGVEYTTSPLESHDLVHVNFPGPKSLAAALAAKARGRKVVVHAHSVGENVAGTHRFSRTLAPVARQGFRRLFDAADAVVAVNEFMRDRLAANGVDADDVFVVTNGVDGDALDGHEAFPRPAPGSETGGRARPDGGEGVALAESDEAVEHAAADSGGDHATATDGPVVVNLAQVYEIKGVGDFVRVGEHLPGTEFRWFGPRHPYLAPRTTKRTVADAPPNVRFPGFVADKRTAFGLGDVFFFPTHRDNQPLAVLEAAYCGLPIVTRDVPAFEGWLEHGVHCLKGDSVAAFADHLARLRDDPALRERLGANAAEMADSHSLDVVGEGLRGVYERVLDD